MRMHLGRILGTGLLLATNSIWEIYKRALLIFYRNTNVVKKICLQNNFLKNIYFNYKFYFLGNSNAIGIINFLFTATPSC